MATKTAESGSSLAGIAQLLSLFTGGGDSKTKTSGQTTTSTSQTQLSTEQMQQMLQSALEGNSGLASIAQGQASSGMYNSTVNTQLTNDLLSRLTTQVATAAAPKVTTQVTTPQTVTKQQEAALGGNSLLGLLGISAAKGTIDPYITGKKSIKDAVMGLFGSDSGSGNQEVAMTALPELSNTALDTSMLAWPAAIAEAGSSPDYLTTVGDLLTGALENVQDITLPEVSLPDVDFNFSDIGDEISDMWDSLWS